MIPIVGIGAGLVSALLFSVVITGSPLAALLYSAAPLPIFIASLGWNHRSGLFATAAGALAVAVHGAVDDALRQRRYGGGVGHGGQLAGMGRHGQADARSLRGRRRRASHVGGPSGPSFPD